MADTQYGQQCRFRMAEQLKECTIAVINFSVCIVMTVLRCPNEACRCSVPTGMTFPEMPTATIFPTNFPQPCLKSESWSSSPTILLVPCRFFHIAIRPPFTYYSLIHCRVSSSQPSIRYICRLLSLTPPLTSCGSEKKREKWDATAASTLSKGESASILAILYVCDRSPILFAYASRSTRSTRSREWFSRQGNG